jgi:Bacterial TSP3 repeat
MPAQLSRPGRRFARLPALLVAVAIVGLPPAVGAAAGDADNDLLPDGFETSAALTSPTLRDTDGDGLADTYEDPDQDGLTNRQEFVVGTNPRHWDTDRDGTGDRNEDFDADRLRTIFEYQAGTNPLVFDTDHDGQPDPREDADGDGLINEEEQARGTHPRDSDSDNDGWTDAAEVRAGTNPLGPATPSAAGVPPWLRSAPACPIFPATNVWNVAIDDRPVASNSATMINAIGLDRGLHMDFGSYAGYGIPYNVVTSVVAKRTVTFDYDDESDHVGYPIPASPRIEGGSDRHILIVDRDACRLYELFAARRTPSGAWAAGSGATWDLRSNALRPLGWTSADAAGLPILPGLIRYEEVAAGEILHALRFTTNQTRKAYIYPARHYASSSTSTSLPPMGLRVRLKASYDTSGFSPQARVIAEALKQYGMILADNGSPWYISGASDSRFDDDVMHELDVITGRNLEVVDTTGLVNGP